MATIDIIRNGERVTLEGADADAFEAARTPTLNQARREKREAIRVRRNQAELTFPYLGGRYDASAAGRIAVLANAARQSGTGFPVRVAALDDTETSLSRAEMQAFELALATHLQGCSANVVALRQAVNAAGDVAAVRAVDVEAGWP
jgi:hypothetical protein